MYAKLNDKLFLAVGGILFFGTAVWALIQESTLAHYRLPVNAPTNGNVFVPVPLNITLLEPTKWVIAPSQKTGKEWVFDVFTPPQIYYNTLTKKFTVTPPDYRPVVEVVVQEEPFGLSLVQVVQALFRLQLVGVVGDGPTARGNFENQLTGEVTLATTGKKFSSLNLEIANFTAERRWVKRSGADSDILEDVAIAIVKDTVTGQETKLDVKIRLPADKLIAKFKFLDGSEHFAKTGDVVTIGDNTFRIGELTLAPSSAIVTKEGTKQNEAKTERLAPLSTDPAAQIKIDTILVPTGTQAKKRPAATDTLVLPQNDPQTKDFPIF
jgi:hypothetical protein